MGHKGTSRPATAAEIFFSDSVPGQSTDFADKVTFPLFNPVLGTLTEVRFEFRISDFAGGVGYENFGSAIADITVASRVDMTLTDTRPGGVGLISPHFVELARNVPTVSAFDRLVDFGGGSGDFQTFDFPPFPGGPSTVMVGLVDAFSLM
jgi:hypothetical protein